MAKNKSVKVERPASKDPRANAFSRRHESDEAHEEARRAWLKDHVEDKLADVADMHQDSMDLSEYQKLIKLDARFGAGVGASKERARLNSAIAARNGSYKASRVT